MKKIALCFMVTFMSLAFVPLQLKAVTPEEPSSIPAPKPVDSAEVKIMLLRLDEIKAADMSKMKSEEKKELRKEVKSIKHNLREVGGGVYLSVAAIVLIIVLLVVLL
jgi:hypothetical protein